MQREAIQRECELFGNVARERRGPDDEPDGEVEMEVGEGDGFLDDDENGPDVWDTFDADRCGTGGPRGRRVNAVCLEYTSYYSCICIYSCLSVICSNQDVVRIRTTISVLKSPKFRPRCARPIPGKYHEIR